MPAATVALAKQMDTAEREKLLLEHLPQVQYVARRIHGRLPQQVQLEDLVHAGVLGLMDAVRKYDPSKNVQLKYYAEFRIRGAILDSLRLVDWSPRALRRQARRMEQAVNLCKARLGRDPSDVEIAEEMQVSLASLQRLQGDLRGLDIRVCRQMRTNPAIERCRNCAPRRRKKIPTIRRCARRQRSCWKKRSANCREGNARFSRSITSRNSP
jgi:RNA polymerase sigma factor FliA